MASPTLGRIEIPTWLSEKIKASEDFNRDLLNFFDTRDSADSIHGRIALSRFQTDLIDTPEFQRLFRLSQLGFVNLLYRTGNHTRGSHSIGCCGIAKGLISRINHNTRRTANERIERGIGKHVPLPEISVCSAILISTAALLHDLPHAPYSHDVEKKTHKLIAPAAILEAHPHTSSDMSSDHFPDERVYSHLGPYQKHDAFHYNPALYLMLTDAENSVLARVLSMYSESFWELMKLEDNSEITEFVHTVEAICGAKRRRSALVKAKDPRLSTWCKERLLPDLLFHLLAGEDEDDFDDFGTLKICREWTGQTSNSRWGLATDTIKDVKVSQALHRSWFNPYRHDIVGDTLSTDLLDYLARDSSGLGLDYVLDDHLFDYLVLASTGNTGNHDIYHTALDFTDYKRGAVHREVPADIFQMLNARFAIHQKAVFHRVVQAAIAMLWRSLHLLGNRAPKLHELYGWPPNDQSSPGIPCAMIGDEYFLSRLVSTIIDSDDPVKRRSFVNGRSLARRIAERRLYKPLIVIPGDQLSRFLSGDSAQHIPNPIEDEPTIRELAAILDSKYFAPFFRQVESYIEEILTHTVTFDDLCTSYKGMRSETSSRRVIFWALPYKQLYKDPSVHISLSGMKPKRIDYLVQSHREGMTHRRSDLTAVLKSGIDDADAKYRAAWSLSVFLSDGLFYRGILARTDRSLCLDEDQHITHLHYACVLVVAALRAAWEHWTKDMGKVRIRWYEGGGRLIHPLSEDCPPSTVENVLAMMFNDNQIRRAQDFWQSRTDGHQNADYRDSLEGDALDLGIAFGQYVHKQPPKGRMQVIANCRDVRYKFDTVLGATTSLDDLPRLVETFISQSTLAPEQQIQVKHCVTELIDPFLLDNSASVPPIEPWTVFEIHEVIDRTVSFMQMEGNEATGKLLQPFERLATAPRSETVGIRRKLAAATLRQLFLAT